MVRLRFLVCVCLTPVPLVSPSRHLCLRRPVCVSLNFISRSCLCPPPCFSFHVSPVCHVHQCVISPTRHVSPLSLPPCLVSLNCFHVSLCLLPMSPQTVLFLCTFLPSGPGVWVCVLFWQSIVQCLVCLVLLSPSLMPIHSSCVPMHFHFPCFLSVYIFCLCLPQFLVGASVYTPSCLHGISKYLTVFSFPSLGFSWFVLRLIWFPCFVHVCYQPQ